VKIPVMKKCVIMIVEVTQMLMSLKTVTCAVNSEEEGTEEDVMSESARVKWPRLDDQGDWQWKKVDQSYFPRKIPFSEINDPRTVYQKCIGGFQVIF
jgi:hypothetical protein